MRKISLFLAIMAIPMAFWALIHRDPPGLAAPRGGVFRSLRHATMFTVEDFSGYTRVVVKEPWVGAREPVTYNLVSRDAPLPEGFQEGEVIRIPVGRVVSLSSTHLPHLEALGASDALVGFATFKYLTRHFRQPERCSRLTEVGDEGGLDLEKLAVLRPDLVMTYVIANTHEESLARLAKCGARTVINAEYMETSPLGRSEWLKFTALFLGKWDEAVKIFEGVEDRYGRMRDQASGAGQRPTVFTGTCFQGTWYIPGGRSYPAALFRDAGARYLWSDAPQTGTLHLDYETVLTKAREAEFWVTHNTWMSLEDVRGDDERNLLFKSIERGGLWNNSLIDPDGGRNEFYTQGVLYPDLVLGELIHIFHPTLMPQWPMRYYQRLR